MKQLQTEQLPITKGTEFEKIFHRDHRHCSCPIPMVSRKWNDALGRFVGIRLCCMAKALEELTGHRLCEVFDFEPKWQWDCDEMETVEPTPGCFITRTKGPPPPWLKNRMLDKGIEIKNLPEGE